jgi:hypothetical protein
MTPQEVDDYKRKWRPGFSVRLHSDLADRGKTWCRRHLERWQWSFAAYTDVYEHTFSFERAEDALEFAQQWPEYVNQ